MKYKHHIKMLLVLRTRKHLIWCRTDELNAQHPYRDANEHTHEHTHEHIQKVEHFLISRSNEPVIRDLLKLRLSDS